MYRDILISIFYSLISGSTCYIVAKIITFNNFMVMLQTIAAYRDIYRIVIKMAPIS